MVPEKKCDRDFLINFPYRDIILMHYIFECIVNIPFGDFEDVGWIGTGVVAAGTADGANGVVLFSPQVALGGSP